jgi:flagellar biosynthesis/type III secretory pathway chaperone
MNEILVIRLIEIINAEIRSFHRLLELLKAEQAAIVEDDIEGIESSVIAQHEVSAEAQMLEVERIQVVAELSQGLDVDADGVSLTRLILFLEKNQGEELAGMREVLVELNERIRQANENNAFLIRQSMRFTDRCLDILTGQPVGQQTYGKFGATRKSAYGRSVLNRTA